MSAENFISLSLSLSLFLSLSPSLTPSLSLSPQMRSTGIPELTCVEDTDYIRNALVLDKSEHKAEQMFRKVIKKCLNLKYTVRSVDVEVPHTKKLKEREQLKLFLEQD